MKRHQLVALFVLVMVISVSGVWLAGMTRARLAMTEAELERRENAIILEDPKYEELDEMEIAEEWLASTPMVDWDDQTLKLWVHTYVDQVRTETGADTTKVLYDLTVEYAIYNLLLVEGKVEYQGEMVWFSEVPPSDWHYYLEQKTYSQCLQEVIYYIENGGQRPRWVCGDFARFYVGLLRTMGFPAYIERVQKWDLIADEAEGASHVRVVMIDPETRIAYFSDPTWGAISVPRMRILYYKMSERLYRFGNYDETQYEIRCFGILGELGPEKSPDTGAWWWTVP